MVVSRLGFEVDSAQARTASVDLDKLTASAGKAERAERSLAASSKQAETATGQLSRQTRDASTATAQLERSVDMVAAAQGRAVVATRASTAALQAQARAANAAMHNSRQLSFQLIDIGQALATAPTMGIYALQNLGFQVAQIGQLYMGRGGFNQAIKDSAVQVASFARWMGPLAAVVGVAGAALAGMTHEINQVSEVTVGMGDVALAVFQVIRDGIYDFIQPAVQAIAPWFQSAWDIVVTSTKTTINTIIGGFAGAANTVIATWSQVPAAVGDLAFQTADRVYAAVTSMLRSARVEINGFINSINDALGTGIPAIGGGLVGLNPDGTQQRLANPFAGSAAGVGTAASEAFGAGFNRDYVGEFFDAVSVRATQNALAGVTDEANKAGGAMSKAAKDGKDATDDLNKELEKTREFWRDVTGGFVSDLRSGLEEGKGFWRSFADAASNALDKIVDKLMNEVLDALFQVGSAASGVGGGGGGILGFLGGLFGFARGGVIDQGNVVPFARGGIVNRPTLFPMANGAGLMGEAGPEAIMPLRRGADGRLGVSAANSNAANQNEPQHVVVTVKGVFVDDNGVIKGQIVDMGAQSTKAGAAVAINQVSQSLPSMIADAQARRM